MHAWRVRQWTRGILIGGSLFASVGCGWLDSRPPKIPEEKTTPPPDPNLPYFVINFVRADGLALNALTVAEMGAVVKSTSVYALDGHRLAVRKLNSSETIYFNIDFGPGFEIALFTIGSDTTCPDGSYMIRKIPGPAGTCGPVAGQPGSLYVVGEPDGIYGSF